MDLATGSRCACLGNMERYTFKGTLRSGLFNQMLWGVALSTQDGASN